MKKIVVFILLLAGMAFGDPSPSPAPSIGQATMNKDGTIVLTLRATSGSSVGDAQFQYKPDNPQYAEILKHVGGLKPGESKPCPPWKN